MLFPFFENLLERLRLDGAARFHVHVEALVKVDSEPLRFTIVGGFRGDDLVAGSVGHSDPCLPLRIFQPGTLLEDDSAISPDVDPVCVVSVHRNPPVDFHIIIRGFAFDTAFCAAFAHSKNSSLATSVA